MQYAILIAAPLLAKLGSCGGPCDTALEDCGGDDTATESPFEAMVGEWSGNGGCLINTVTLAHDTEYPSNFALSWADQSALMLFTDDADVMTFDEDLDIDGSQTDWSGTLTSTGTGMSLACTSSSLSCNETFTQD